MRNTVKVGLFLCALILPAAHVGASGLTQAALTEDPFHYQSTTTQKSPDTQSAKTENKVSKDSKQEKEKRPLTPPAVTYTVAAGDTLTKIADEHQTEWKRLFFKNTEISDPNTIAVGQILTIPSADEQLTERPLPEVTPAPASAVGRGLVTVANQPRGSAAGNTYTPGYCTWYAKNRRPDLPNRLGNASSWVVNAAAQGFATGATPQAGAIGQQGNHVVYVESVNGDGTVTISEMNYSGLYVISSRTVPASYFTYIY